MGDSLFDIFGDIVTKQVQKNVTRQPLTYNENIGKTVSSGPFKPNEPTQPLKKTESNTKRSFLCNKGKALQSTLQNTPGRQTFTPGIKLGIYSDDKDSKLPTFEEMEFTKPAYNYDNYHTDVFDYLTLPELKIPPTLTPPKTPPPVISVKPTIDFDCSYQDEFYADDLSSDSLPEMDLDLPDIF